LSLFQGASSELDLQARFARATRHSKRVRFLRRAIPVIVLVSLLAILAISTIANPFRMLLKLPLSVGNLVVSGTKVTMESPRLAGYTPDQRAYELSAHAAVQDVTDPTKVELQVLHAKIEMEDKSTVLMDADTGLYDTKSQLLKLDKNIFLQTSAGYEGRLQEALVDIGKGSVQSDKPVAIKLLNGTLDAQRMLVTESGAVVHFEGGVSMILIPDNSTSGATTPSNTK
jgi:lipopolysaccharide export system protein LptC